MQKLPLVTCTPHKMRSAQTPFGAWAIMKKFILYALLSFSFCRYISSMQKTAGIALRRL